MPVSAIEANSGNRGVDNATAELQKAQEKLSAALAAKAAAAKELVQSRDAVARAQQSTEEAKVADAARRWAVQQATTPADRNRPVTASASALGGSFDVLV